MTIVFHTRDIHTHQQTLGLLQGSAAELHRSPRAWQRPVTWNQLGGFYVWAVSPPRGLLHPLHRLQNPHSISNGALGSWNFCQECLSAKGSVSDKVTKVANIFWSPLRNWFQVIFFFPVHTIMCFFHLFMSFSPSHVFFHLFMFFSPFHVFHLYWRFPVFGDNGINTVINNFISQLY